MGLCLSFDSISQVIPVTATLNLAASHGERSGSLPELENSAYQVGCDASERNDAFHWFWARSKMKVPERVGLVSIHDYDEDLLLQLEPDLLVNLLSQFIRIVQRQA